MRKKLVLASPAAKGEYEVESTPCAAVQYKIDNKKRAVQQRASPSIKIATAVPSIKLPDQR